MRFARFISEPRRCRYSTTPDRRNDGERSMAVRLMSLRKSGKRFSRPKTEESRSTDSISSTENDDAANLSEAHAGQIEKGRQKDVGRQRSRATSGRENRRQTCPSHRQMRLPVKSRTGENHQPRRPSQKEQ